MKLTAQRVRDGRGLRPLVTGLFHDDMGAQRLGGAEEVVWKALNLTKFFSSTLKKLEGQDDFNFLANRLINIVGYPAETAVLAATKHGMRIIEIRGKQFVAKGYYVHERQT